VLFNNSLRISRVTDATAASTMPTIQWNTRGSRQRSASLLGVAALHALIAAAWMAGRPAVTIPRADGARIQWLWLRPAQPPKPPQPSAARVDAPPPVPVPAIVPRTIAPPAPIRVAPVAVPEAPAPEPAPAAATSTVPEPAPTAPAALDGPGLAARARQMAGGVDKQLRKESGKPLPELVDTPYKRFVAEMAAAYAPQFTGEPTITEFARPGSGEKIVKVSFGSHSYCLRVPSPSMRIDEYQAARTAVPMTCP